MANVKILAPIIIEWESRKFTNDPIDRGHATKDGITLSTWMAQGYDKDGDGDVDVDDLKLINNNDFEFILKLYWNSWKADQINNQSIANILVDWVWGSGSWGIKIPQRILGLTEDGVVGKITLNAVNTANQKGLFQDIKKFREQFLWDIVKRDPTQQRFIKGWLNRLADFGFSE